ncbi:diaminopropionate ammonia-lyase [Christensenellaceae bacterium OttesenSCG-928-K19]|nr:diaminopropionate ammonia-lyase [Christensenellaceae bacterium OttesenSCG-928-K19]
MENIKWVANNLPKTENKEMEIMSLENVDKARLFHESFPQYETTPLVRLDNLAAHLGLGSLFIKDESYRFGLNAFKVLGGSYAMACYIADKVGRDVAELTYDVLTSEKLRQEFGQAVFFTATDGNHGRGVAWAANKLGQKSVVYMPKGSTQTRLDNILKENAKVEITEMNYDECVRRAAKEAGETKNGVVVQDTAWEGYEDIPAHIMQGYGTMASEAAEQLKVAGISRPTHIFVQAGVGSFAGAVQGYFANLFPDDCPTTVVVEANAADCIYQSAAAGDGSPRAVYGDMQTIMAGLNCGEPNTISWEILKNNTAFFVSCPDWVSARGMRILGAPMRGDTQVVSGESGAVSAGLIEALMSNPEHAELKNALGLDSNSKILMFSTEGDTDPEQYKKIVWDGTY